MAEIRARRQALEPWERLEAQAADLVALAELAAEEQDAASAAEAERELRALQARLGELEHQALLSGEYDNHNAFLSVNAGAGGTEACDWVEMLMRMYLRWAERRGYEAETIDRTPGESAGSKSMTARIAGPNAYGYLKAERGVHRLVRLSPFDAAHRRHTSFASVNVAPEVAEQDAEINPDDLKVETFRSSSAGGQHVQKTESAVRITHLPTGIVVSCQNERSQHKNRATAMKVLAARLLERRRQEQEQELARVRGEKAAIEWGNQIRSYVLQPYVMVKDHRTGHETGNAERVLDGEIDEFIIAELQREAAPAA
jgi:peptide chain release factor 2